MWEWLNAHLIADGLRTASVDVRGDVLDDLDLVLASPFSPSGVEHHRMTIEGKQERCVAWLRHGYVLTYRPYISGPPPLAGRHVSVLAFVHISDLLGE